MPTTYKLQIKSNQNSQTPTNANKPSFPLPRTHSERMEFLTPNSPSNPFINSGGFNGSSQKTMAERQFGIMEQARKVTCSEENERVNNREIVRTNDATRAAVLMGYGGGSVAVAAGVQTVKYGVWGKVAGSAAKAGAIAMSDGPVIPIMDAVAVGIFSYSMYEMVVEKIGKAEEKPSMYEAIGNMINSQHAFTVATLASGIAAAASIASAASEEASGVTVKPKDIDIDNLPDGWTRTDNNGHIHVRDANGKLRLRVDPPDAKTDYEHEHYYDENENPVDKEGNPVDRKSPDAHTPRNK